MQKKVHDDAKKKILLMQIKGRTQDASWYKEAILSVLKQNYSLFT